jgi:hypothetical protein
MKKEFQKEQRYKMNENNHDDFSFFAGGKRVKKEDIIPAKSPLNATNKWNLQTEEPVQIKTQVQKVEVQILEEPIGNIGSELQKFRKYPEKTYDKYLNKMVTFNEEDFYLIRDLSSEISMARKRSQIPNKGSLPRITENTVIRAALKAIFSKIGNSNLDLSTLQTEEALENYFNRLLK